MNDNPTQPVTHNARRVRPGISVLLGARRDLLHGRRVGVLTGPSGVLPDLTGSAEALLRSADVRALFGPEHGLRGAAAPGAHIAGELHPSGVAIYSLYGADLAPTPEQLADLEVIVCDIQDVGCRFYTYAWTLVMLMRSAAAAGVAVIVTDRPNPLGGAIEGPGVDEGRRTLVGLHDVPIRHGLTLGELARLANGELAIGCDLTVIPCEGWRRADRWEATGLPWVPPSPNMPTAATALLYPGTCLIEGTNLSVGRGTALPFEWLGAPWLDGVALAETLNSAGLSGVRWRPVAFQPCTAPYAGELCYGVQPHVVDAETFRPVLSGITLVAALHNDQRSNVQPSVSDKFAWSASHFDRLAGSPRIRESIDAGVPPAEIAAEWRANEAAFRERVAPFLLYPL
jgi:uncharacterized protein YbbC (DUF1343 family)